MMAALLQKSIEQYRRIIAHAQGLEELLVKGDPEQLRNYTATLAELQAEAGLHDRELLAAMARDAARWQAHPLFAERLQLLEQIVEMNHLLLPRIHGMMSVTAAELVQIKDGRVAVAGYYPATSRPGGSVRSVG
jgi:hypothetical protein